MLLAEMSCFPPIVNFQARNDGVLRQRRGVEQPCIGNDLLKLHKILVAELTAPKLAQWLQPKKREPHLLLQIGFKRRRNMRSSVRGCLEYGLNVWNVREVEQLKKP